MAVLSRRSVRMLATWLVVIASASTAWAVPDHVIVQLKWKHQFQFAGFYAAEAAGYYRDAGLEVELREVDFAKPPITAVLDGSAQFATVGSDGLVARMRGKPVVALAVIYQHSPFYFLTRDPHVKNPADLLGKKVMMTDQQGEAELLGTMAREGLVGGLQIIREWDPQRFRSGEVDAVAAYTTDLLGVIWPGLDRVGTIRPAEYGIDFYGDTLFTSEAEIAAHPERVRRFRAATLRGWEYAFAHPTEVIDRILMMPGVAERGITQAFLEHEVVEMRKLVLPDLVDLGHINPARFHRMAEVYAQLGIHQGSWSLDGMYYQPDEAAARWPRWLGLAIIGLAAMTLLAAAWAWQLRRAVRVRTAELAIENDRRRDAETRLQLSHDVLEERVDERTEALGHALAQMETFSYSVSHDLRAPLRGIDGLLRIIEEDYANALPDEGKQLLVRVQAAARKMDQLIEDLLTLSRVGRAPLRREPIAMRKLVEEVFAELAPSGREVQLEIGELPPCEADPTLLRQVVVNLLANALKFSREQPQARIQITADRQPDDADAGAVDEVTYQVSDNGVGFDMQYATKLFQVFERMHPTSKFEGTGVGLAIVKNVITRHGGRVGAESTLGVGATFWFTLPRQPSTPKPQETNRP